MHPPALECECDINYSAPVALFVGDADSATYYIWTTRLSKVVQNIESIRLQYRDIRYDTMYRAITTKQ